MPVLKVERTLAAVTWRMLLGRYRWIALLACNALPTVIAWVVNAEEAPSAFGSSEGFVGALLASAVLAGLLPLAGLVYGTAALGQEIEDGTLGYVLAKPLPRWRLAVTKAAVSAAATVAAVLPGVVFTGWIALGDPAHPLVLGFGVGVVVASVLYAGVFLALSLFIRRALLVGLIYIVVWEGALSQLFAGTRSLSVREYATSISELVAGIPLPDALSSSLAASTAITMSVVILAAVLAVATQRLRTFELVGEG